MPVVLRDTLTSIKTFNGSHGKFVTAKVHSDIGDFVLKDAALDQFVDRDGLYQASFIVTRIFIHTRRWGASFISELRINVSKMKLVKIEAVTPVDDLSVESDPLLETPVEVPVTDSPACVAAAPTPKAIVPTEPSTETAEQAGQADSVAVEASVTQAAEPVAETAAEVAALQAVEAADSTVVVTEQEAGSGQDDGMADLFGQMWPNVQARKPVVITDWTDRAAIRRQREVLVGLGYVLDPATMTWSMPEPETA